MGKEALLASSSFSVLYCFPCITSSLYSYHLFLHSSHRFMLLTHLICTFSVFESVWPFLTFPLLALCFISLPLPFFLSFYVTFPSPPLPSFPFLTCHSLFCPTPSFLSLPDFFISLNFLFCTCPFLNFSLISINPHCLPLSFLIWAAQLEPVPAPRFLPSPHLTKCALLVECWVSHNKNWYIGKRIWSRPAWHVKCHSVVNWCYLNKICSLYLIRCPPHFPYLPFFLIYPFFSTLYPHSLYPTTLFPLFPFTSFCILSPIITLFRYFYSTSPSFLVLFIPLPAFPLVCLRLMVPSCLKWTQRQRNFCPTDLPVRLCVSQAGFRTCK